MGKALNGKNLGKGFSQRKDGRYEARATINGVKIDLYDMSLSKLKKAFELKKAEVLRDEKGVRPNVTLKDWYEEWFEKFKVPQLKSTSSIKSYNRKTKNTFIAILGEKRVKDITQINLQVATNELTEKGYGERTIREAIGVLRECLDIAVINRIIPVNPCVGLLVKSTYTQHKRRVMTHEEQDIFLNEAKSSYYYEAYAILLLTGIRIGEFSGLQWQDINFVDKEIYIKRSMSTAYIDGTKIEELTTPKTFNSFRTIPFFGETEDLLKSWKKKQAEIRDKMGDRWRAKPEFGDLVFTSTVGSPVTRYVIAHDLTKIVQNINLRELYKASAEGRPPKTFERLHPHAFRHTFATRCFEKGLDPLFIQSIMGHANYSTTISYTHVLDDTISKEVKKAGNFLS